MLARAVVRDADLTNLVARERAIHLRLGVDSSHDGGHGGHGRGARWQEEWPGARRAGRGAVWEAGEAGAATRPTATASEL